MEKRKDLSVPSAGMKRAISPHLAQEGDFLFMLNGTSTSESGDRPTLTAEQSNILAVQFPEGYNLVGLENHVVRNKTYVFITNNETGVSEIGCIRNTRNFTYPDTTPSKNNCPDCPTEINLEATPLEQQTQTPHQIYETLLSDDCNKCLGFDIDHPIIDVIIKEQNIGTTMFWTSTPGKKEFRYIELDNIDQYKLTGDDNCGEAPTETCLDCEKLRVFRPYLQLKSSSHKRVLGGRLQKGSYEILGAYSDILGNEITDYTVLTPIIPIFDQANIIHEQSEDNAVTNFAIKLELETVDARFDHYKIAYRYYTSEGVFTSFVEGIHNTSDKIVIISNNIGSTISNQELALRRPYIESVDGIAQTNSILVLHGIREREPINLQPVVSLAGLAVNWMSYRAKEDLYSQADSYKFLGYNRDEVQQFSIDFGFKDGYRTNNFIFIPDPATEQESQEIATGDDYNSITDIVGDCDGNIRTKRHQFYNTATEIGSCPLEEEVQTTTQVENIQSFTIAEVPSIPSGSINIFDSNQGEFIDLKSFIEDNISDPNILTEGIAPFVDLTNLTSINNPPELPANSCQPYGRPTEELILIQEVENETILENFITNTEDYTSVQPPQNVQIFEQDGANSKIDDDFSYAYNSDGQNEGSDDNRFTPRSRKRSTVFFNTRCNDSQQLIRVNNSNVQTVFGSYHHNNQGGLSIEELQESSVNMPVTVQQGTADSRDGIFTDKLHKTALWFRGQKSDRDFFYINLSKRSSCQTERIKLSGLTHLFGGDKTNFVRVSVFNTCNDTSPIKSEIVDLSTTTFIEINQAIVDQLTTENYYISVETSIRQAQGLGPDYEQNNCIESSSTSETPKTNCAFITTFIANIPCGAFNIVDRDREVDFYTVSWDSINIAKSQRYSTQCTFEVPVLKDCEPVPSKYGTFGHYESTEKYPDNEELYDSSTLVIKKSLITSSELATKIQVYVEDETEQEYNLNENADFRCKNIRGYRFPDNKVSPFIRTEIIASNSETIIHPIGMTIDGEVINNLLDIAVDNELITQELRDQIIDYKIYRADSTLDRSIVASGLVFNTKSYQDDGDEINYFNYPFNSLGGDKYFPDSSDNPFRDLQAISPEFDYFRPSLPNEMSIQGFMFGRSNTRILPVEDHAKMVILGRKARTLATVLAALEAAAELAIRLAEASEVYRVDGGFVFSANPVGIGLHIAAGIVGLADSITTKVGRYRLEWLRTFENLGTPYNFGYYMAAGSNYNYLRPLQTEGDQIRGLSVRKYLTSGMLNVSDTTSGSITRINNIDREDAPYFGLGNYPINNLPLEYTQFDNVDTAPNFSSQITSSEVGCHSGKSPEKQRNIASPYVAFKNYIPNQYGTVNSIRWVDTTFCIPIEETGVCNGVLGGDTFISRHSKKRKTRMFESDMLGLADLTPFSYEFNSNYGRPKYFIDFKVNDTIQTGSQLFPNIFYEFEFDCNTSENFFYIRPPAKFYLYNIAYTNFLCETRVNTNFRNARVGLENQFFPQNEDYETISQPVNVPLTAREQFFYNSAYLQTSTQGTNFMLPEFYSKEDQAKLAYNINSGIYSLPDVNENSITEPWLVYRPNDRFTLESKYGDLINIKGIESDQILMFYENALQLQNSTNPFTDGSTEYNRELGNGGIFAKRALTLRSTDIGYGGTQSKQTLSCEFGHFYADANRGQVFNYTGGQNLTEISRYAGRAPNYMDSWFKEHLPFKITRTLPDINTDNAYNGVGLVWGYDSKYRRVILTKKDYIPTSSVINCDNAIYDNNLENYTDVIEDLQNQGYQLEGVEDCRLKFTKNSLLPNTDIYAIFDTTSMQFSDGQAASIALNTWFTSFQNNNPNFTGNLYIIPYRQENYLDFPTRIQNGDIEVTGGIWEPISVLPPNLNTNQWIAPEDLLLLAFVDEAAPQYHGNSLVGGFSSSSFVQPTNPYIEDYQKMVNTLESYNSFRGVIYPIVQGTPGEALVLQTLAAIEGRILTADEITQTNTSVDVSLLLTENPYENAVIPGTFPEETLQPLSTFNWVGQYDKTSPASAVFSSQQFQNDLNNLIVSGDDNEVLFQPLREVELTDTNFFEDASWTITYRPETGMWESYMSYTPNYYINHTDYFQSGQNTTDDKSGLWSHLLTNRSYRVFYGHKFPYIVEYPIKNTYLSRRLESIDWNAQLRHYHNAYDYATIEENPFDKVTIFNDYENSGNLIPIKNNGTLSQLSDYPITNNNNSQDVLVTYDDYRYGLNYFYNRVISNKNNQPVWIWDENQIEKIVNPKAVSFYSKKTLERLKGNYFTVRLERNSNTNLDIDLRWSEQTTDDS